MVRLETGPEGTLIDLNEFGALLELTSPEAVDSRLTFDLFWEGVPVRLHGRGGGGEGCGGEEGRIE